MKIKYNNNDPARFLVKRAMDLTVQTASLTWAATVRGLFISMGAAMKNTPEMDLCEELVRVDIPKREWEERQIKECARKFRLKVREDLLRAFSRMEVSHV